MLLPMNFEIHENLTCCADGKRWEPRHSLGGHWESVVGLSWSFDGRLLYTASADQTARILTQAADGQWLEIARPQVLSTF